MPFFPRSHEGGMFSWMGVKITKELYLSISRWPLRLGRHLHFDAAHPDRRQLVRFLLQEPALAQ